MTCIVHTVHTVHTVLYILYAQYSKPVKCEFHFRHSCFYNGAGFNNSDPKMDEFNVTCDASTWTLTYPDPMPYCVDNTECPSPPAHPTGNLTSAIDWTTVTFLDSDLAR